MAQILEIMPIPKSAEEMRSRCSNVAHTSSVLTYSLHGRR